MNITLPQACIGEKILKFFAEAAIFGVYSQKRWDAFETVEAECVTRMPQFVPKGGVFEKKGMDIILSTRKKRWGLFGEYVWKPESSFAIRLVPLDLEAFHKIVKISIVRTSPQKGRMFLSGDIDDPLFAEFRAHSLATIGRFFDKVTNYRY